MSNSLISNKRKYAADIEMGKIRTGFSILVKIRFGTEAEKQTLLNEYPEIKNVVRDGGYFIASVIEDTVIGFFRALKCEMPASALPKQRRKCSSNLKVFLIVRGFYICVDGRK